MTPGRDAFACTRGSSRVNSKQEVSIPPVWSYVKKRALSLLLRRLRPDRAGRSRRPRPRADGTARARLHVGRREPLLRRAEAAREAGLLGRREAARTDAPAHALPPHRQGLRRTARLGQRTRDVPRNPDTADRAPYGGRPRRHRARSRKPAGTARRHHRPARQNRRRRSRRRDHPAPRAHPAPQPPPRTERPPGPSQLAGCDRARIRTYAPTARGPRRRWSLCRRWSLYGAKWTQPLATVRKASTVKA